MRCLRRGVALARSGVAESLPISTQAVRRRGVHVAASAAQPPQGLALSHVEAQRSDMAACRAVVGGWRREYTPGPLSEAQLDQFFTDGYVLLENVLPVEDLQPSIEAVDELVDGMAKDLLAAGKISDAHPEADFLTRLTLLEKQFPDASVVLHKLGVLPQAIAELWAHPKLLDAAQQIVGDNVAGHPVWNLRTKTPDQALAVVPWHQDAAYMTPASWQTLQCTAWVPLVNATKENGCMEVIRGGHRSGLTATHTCCAGQTWYVDLPEDTMEEELGVDMEKDVVLCEVPLGGALLLNNLLPHRSLPNRSNEVRWSLDLRWQDPAMPSGFDGKDSILMRKPGKLAPTQAEWDEWNAVQRISVGIETASGGAPAVDASSEEFDTIIMGPWMDNWPLVNTNRHTDAWVAATKA